jgi:hypothetical protein
MAIQQRNSSAFVPMDGPALFAISQWTFAPRIPIPAKMVKIQQNPFKKRP